MLSDGRSLNWNNLRAIIRRVLPTVLFEGDFWCLMSVRKVAPPNANERLNDRTNEALDNPKRLRVVEQFAAPTTMINNDFASKSSRILASDDVARMTGLLSQGESEDKWIVTESQRTQFSINVKNNSNLFCFRLLFYVS